MHLGFRYPRRIQVAPMGLLQAYFNAPALARPCGIPFICAVAALLLLGHSGAMPGVARLATTQMNETGALKQACSKPDLLQGYYNPPALARPCGMSFSGTAWKESGYCMARSACNFLKLGSSRNSVRALVINVSTCSSVRLNEVGILFRNAFNCSCATWSKLTRIR